MRARALPGLLALAFLSLLAGGALAGLLREGARDWSGAFAAFDAYLLRVARFTLLQAALSALISVAPAIFVARALSRRRSFAGRELLLRLFSVPLALPALVAALGLLALFGRAGYLADALAAGGLHGWPGVYGLSGILIAHAFFNLPLAARLILQALDAVPADQWRLAAQLGMGPWAVFRLLEWPAIRAVLPGVAGLVFMLCVTSFTIVLTLGGGPAATTLEVAIYQALRFDFDPARAFALTLAQVVLTATVVAMLTRLGVDPAAEPAASVSARRHAGGGLAERAIDAAVIAAAAAFVAAPLAAILVSGLRADLARLSVEASVLAAAATSIGLAVAAGLLATALSWSLASGRWRLKRHDPRLAAFMDGGASLILVVPAVVIGAGWFMLLRGAADAYALAPAVVVAVNAAMATPFAIRAIRPAHDAASARHDRLCAQLGIGGLNRLRLVEWPALRGPLLSGFAFAMALSLGDLGVIALFGSDAVQTLPYLLLQRIGSYRTQDAAGIALLLALLCLSLTALAEAARGRRR